MVQPKSIGEEDGYVAATEENEAMTSTPTATECEPDNV